MAKIDQVLSFSKDLATYLKACKKSSVLQTKAVIPSQLKDLKFATTLNTDVVEITSKKIYDIIPLHRNCSVGSNSSQIREFLSTNADEFIEEYGKRRSVEQIYFINHIDDQFRLLKPLEEPIVAYRGMNNQHRSVRALDNMCENIAKLKEGDIFVLDNGYSFYGTSSDCLKMFGNRSKGLSDGTKVIRITANFPQGSYVSRGISTNPEYGLELLTPRGANYKLVSKKPNQYNGYDIVVDYTQGEFPPKLKINQQLKEVEEHLLKRGDLDCYLKKT